MRRSHVVLAGILMIACVAPASGQTSDAAAVPTPRAGANTEQGATRQAQSAPRTDNTVDVGPVVLPFVQYGAPQRLTGGVSAFLPVGRGRREEGAVVMRGIELQGSMGLGGWRTAAGVFHAGLPWFWADALVTATRTRDDPRGAIPGSTYVGAEAGIAFITPVNEYLSLPFAVMIKPNFGFAHRPDGPPGPKRTMYTWSVGAHIVTKPLVF